MVLYEDVYSYGIGVCNFHTMDSLH